MNTYPTTHQELWSRLLQFQFDEPSIALPFSRRLSRENSWTGHHTKRVIEEYRRFIFLTMTAGHPVTPSVDVDQAWHLHLTYTRSYWDDLCSNVLGTPLHHQPTKGGNREGAKFEDWYARTLESYRRTFNAAPPADIWPPPAVRLAAESRIRQVSDRTHWVIRKPRLRGVGIATGGAALALVLTGCGLVDGGSSSLFLWVGIPVVVIGMIALLIRKGKEAQQGTQQQATTDGGYMMTGDTGTMWFPSTDSSSYDNSNSGTESGADSSSSDSSSWGGDSSSSSSDSSSSDSSSSSGDSGCSGCGGCGGGD